MSIDIVSRFSFRDLVPIIKMGRKRKISDIDLWPPSAHAWVTTPVYTEIQTTHACHIHTHRE